MGDPEILGRLVARAAADERAERDRAPLGHALGENRESRGQGRPAEGGEVVHDGIPSPGACPFLRLRGENTTSGRGFPPLAVLPDAGCRLAATIPVPIAAPVP